MSATPHETAAGQILQAIPLPVLEAVAAVLTTEHVCCLLLVRTHTARVTVLPDGGGDSIPADLVSTLAAAGFHREGGLGHYLVEILGGEA